MVKSHIERISSNFEGTIIDFETIGHFTDCRDSRRYMHIKPVIFGYITKDGLKVTCARGQSSLAKLSKIIVKALPELPRPLSAFNVNFERGVLFHSLGMNVAFESELNAETYEKKADVVRRLNLSQYNDPFSDSGYRCMVAWQAGDVDNAIRHNRSCLLKERDILLKRGYRKPDRMEMVK